MLFGCQFDSNRFYLWVRGKDFRRKEIDSATSTGKKNLCLLLLVGQFFAADNEAILLTANLRDYLRVLRKTLPPSSVSFEERINTLLIRPPTLAMSALTVESQPFEDLYEFREQFWLIIKANRSSDDNVFLENVHFTVAFILSCIAIAQLEHPGYVRATGRAHQFCREYVMLREQENFSKKKKSAERWVGWNAEEESWIAPNVDGCSLGSSGPSGGGGGLLRDDSGR
ncbi:hypothetical protein VNO77_43369 [Canavalia gladiata]|uniref:Uncharacterized protein n=1 Tax=Canavalia gladiata TaxID=3824 RepID=A0AAN9PPZ5_CANGL